MIGQIDFSNKKVIVIGGGISGLLSAYYLSKNNFEVFLHEASSRLGGLLETIQTPYGLVEKAAHSFLSNDEVEELLSELGLEVLNLNQNSKARFILRNSKFRKIPFHFFEFIVMLLRLSFVKHKDEYDNNAAIWVEKHLGKAAVDNLFFPFINGIYASFPEEIAIKTAFKKLKLKNGETLLKFFLKKIFLKKKKNKIIVLKNGTESLVSYLEKYLKNKENVKIYLNSKLNSIPDFSNVVICTPSEEARRLINLNNASLNESFNKIKYSSLVSVAVFVSKDEVVYKPGIGVLLARNQHPHILGVLYNSCAFLNRSTEGYESFTVMLGGSLSPDVVKKSDEQIIEIILDFFKKNYSLKGDLKKTVISRWSKAIPKYSTDLYDFWDIASQTWCKKKGHVLFSNYTGEVSIRGLIATARNGFVL